MGRWRWPVTFLTDPRKIPIPGPAATLHALFSPATPGIVPIAAEPDLFYLDGPLVYRDGDLTITIPAGFITDDASVPKAVDWVPFLDRQGLSRRPGLLHDGIYSLGREKGKDWADGMLERACIAEGMSAWQARCYYLGVHMFGASSWAKDAAGGKVGADSGDFISAAYYQMYLAAGASIYS